MRLGDLPWIAILIVLVVLALESARRLRAMPDWQKRLADSHAPVYVRLGEHLFWLVRHLLRALFRRERRLQHLQRALLALAFLSITALTPILTIARGVDPDFAKHGLAIGVGALVWTIVVESPAVSDRIRRLSARVDLFPVLVHVLIVSVLDAAISCLALSGRIEGEPLASACVGAAFVAAADIVSTAVGVAAATLPRYPLLDPPEEVEPGRLGDCAPRSANL